VGQVLAQSRYVQDNWRTAGKFADSRSLAVRGESFNTWNHTRFPELDNSANFSNGVNINPNFATPTAARNPRYIQFSARLAF
jgi:hypothetical protein